jgi:NAD(P)-dependent dehydrogenase (short-subunit alcohol dehydrogenase family)
MSLFDLTGKVALITGASKGIGKAIAMAYARAGASVVVSSRKQELLDQVAAEIQESGGRALAVQAHVGHPDQIAALMQRAEETFGGLDIVVNNAATNPYFGPLLGADVGVWDKIMEVNLRGYFLVAQHALPLLNKRGGGKIINLASVAGFKPMPGLGVYAVSKAGVIMLTKVLAQELGRDNIQVNAIAPGVIRTKFSRALWDNPAIAQWIEEGTPAGRIGAPEDVVGAALFLASPASDYVNGTVVVVDGGMLVGTR